MPYVFAFRVLLFPIPYICSFLSFLFQGMNFIVAMFLLFMDEEDAFW